MIIFGFWFFIWELFTRLVDNSFLLVGPMEAFRHIFLLMEKAAFFRILSFSSFRILSAYFLAFFLALALALFSYRHRFFENLIQPPLFLLRSLPVASFVIILLFFIGRANLSFFISFWMSFPIFYFNFLEGLKKLDKDILEMANVFRLSPWNRFRYILIPGIYPQMLSKREACYGTFLEKRNCSGTDRTSTKQHRLSAYGCKGEPGYGRGFCVEHYHDCFIQVF